MSWPKERGAPSRQSAQGGRHGVFDNTWDRNGNGVRDDALTHIGIVETVDTDGTITLVHLGSKGVVRIQMNLQRPSVTKREGKVLNSYLRRGSTGERLRVSCGWFASLGC